MIIVPPLPLVNIVDEKIIKKVESWNLVSMISPCAGGLIVLRTRSRKSCTPVQPAWNQGLNMRVDFVVKNVERIVINESVCKCRGWIRAAGSGPAR